MATLQSEIGNRYGRLVVIKRAENQGTRAQWLCQCDCGTEKVISGKHLRRGTTTSCGCVRREQSAKQGRLNRLSETEARRRCLENGFELLSEYKGVMRKARFRCRSCGHEFERRAETSIYGICGCDRCSKQGYDFNRKAMIEDNESYADKKAFLYLMQLTGNGETFYKIGFTSLGVQQRIRKIPYVMTDVEVVETTVKRAYALEQEIKAAIAPYRYRPQLNFAGCAECFQPAPLENKPNRPAGANPM
jgi:hypothetical protein